MLDRDRCLEIMEGCGVVPRDLRVLHAYWDSLRMVAHMFEYYGAALQGFWGVTQGDPLSTTIFNAVVEAVVLHWILLVVVGVEAQGGWGR